MMFFYNNSYWKNLYVILLDKIQLSSIGIILHKVISNNIDRDIVAFYFLFFAKQLIYPFIRLQ